MIAPASSPAAPLSSARILCVDDEPSILSALRRVFRPHGHQVFIANSGREGLELLEREPVDLVISDMRMPEMDGARFLEQVRERWPDTKRILLTGFADIESTVAAINRGKIWCYIAKPWNDQELVATVEQALEHRRLAAENAHLNELTQRQNDELKELNASLEQKVVERTAQLADALKSVETAHGQLRQAFLATVQMFSGLVELRGGKLAGHSRRVADTARRLSEQMNLSEAEQQSIFLAALLHDIGKIGLPDKLLNSPFNSLTQQERKEMMTHPLKGQQLLMAVEQLAEAAILVRHHHELFNGKGYPDQLVGLAIPLGARILALANDYDALQCGTLTLHEHTQIEAQQLIQKERGLRYDPAVVDTFFAMLIEEAKKHPQELSLRVAQLKSGMVLSRDLLHRDGYILLPKGRTLNGETITRLAALETAEGQTLMPTIRNDVAPGVLRDRQPEPPPPLWKEMLVPVERLRPGMVLSRSLYHKEGYLLLAGSGKLDEAIIRQLAELEHGGEPLKIFIRTVER